MSSLVVEESRYPLEHMELCPKLEVADLEKTLAHSLNKCVGKHQ